MRLIAVVLSLAAGAGLLSACGNEQEGGTATGLVLEGPETGHVHAIGVDPADGAIVIAAHTGLFRAEAGASRASRLGDERRDVMGFTVEGARRYAGSGHPDPRAGGPSSVGFIRSGDAGRSWRTVSLAGEADLHVLEVASGRTYGFDALGGGLLASSDGGRSWRRSAVPPVLDLAIDPADPDTVVASTARGLLRSRNGGRSWQALDATPPSHLVWRADGLLRLGLDGAVRRAAHPGARVQVVGRLPMPPAAATQDGAAVLVATDDGTVLESRDAGRSWKQRLGPAT